MASQKTAKTYKVVYWGGPKDGRVDHFEEIPPVEIFCETDESSLLSLTEVYNIGIKQQERPQYHRYIRGQGLKDKTIRYKFHGLY